MGQELICSWFGLPPDTWPPDHYRLLGLDPGEDNAALIEQRVHQRLDSVRCYQMMHPELATEAMNRLAQAFVCLTEEHSKQAYDEQLLGVKARVAPPPLPAPLPLPKVSPPPLPPPLPGPEDPLVWLYTPGVTGPGAPLPPPVRVNVPITGSGNEGDRPAPSVAASDPGQSEEEAPPPPSASVETETPTAPPLDPIVQAAKRSPQARRGLGTRRHLLERIYQTRHLIRLWHRLGKHLDDVERSWSKADASDLYKTATKVEEGVEDFPLLGEAGQPGYFIVSLTQLEKSRDLLNLTHRERETLQRDWAAGLKFLTAHAEFLRGEVLHQRQRGLLHRTVRAIETHVVEHPLTSVLVSAGILALLIALLRSLE